MHNLWEGATTWCLIYDDDDDDNDADDDDDDDGEDAENERCVHISIAKWKEQTHEENINARVEIK